MYMLKLSTTTLVKTHGYIEEYAINICKENNRYLGVIHINLGLWLTCWSWVKKKWKDYGRRKAWQRKHLDDLLRCGN